MIVLTKDQLEKFYEIKEKFQDLFTERNVDYIPIGIKNDLFILPEEILKDDNFKEMKDYLIENKYLDTFEFRDVKEKELIVMTRLKK